MLVAGVAPGAQALRQAPIVAGRNLRPDDDRQVVLGDVMAESLGLAPGATIEFDEESFEVVGVARWKSRMNRSASC